MQSGSQNFVERLTQITPTTLGTLSLFPPLTKLCRDQVIGYLQKMYSLFHYRCSMLYIRGPQWSILLQKPRGSHHHGYQTHAPSRQSRSPLQEQSWGDAKHPGCN